MKKISLLYLFVFIVSACAPAGTPSAAPAQTTEATTTFAITSTAFAQEGSIPVDYACTGKNISPPLAWTEPPAGTKSLALIVDDPDAGSNPWVHWVIFNIPASARGLKEGLPADAQLADGSIQGRTSAGRSGYHGPCPPSGTHHYHFKLYALDAMLELSSDANKEDMLAAMESHILADAELVGTFKK